MASNQRLNRSEQREQSVAPLFSLFAPVQTVWRDARSRPAGRAGNSSPIFPPRAWLVIWSSSIDGRAAEGAPKRKSKMKSKIMKRIRSTRKSRTQFVAWTRRVRADPTLNLYPALHPLLNRNLFLNFALLLDDFSPDIRGGHIHNRSLLAAGIIRASKAWVLLAFVFPRMTFPMLSRPLAVLTGR